MIKHKIHDFLTLEISEENEKALQEFCDCDKTYKLYLSQISKLFAASSGLFGDFIIDFDVIVRLHNVQNILNGMPQYKDKGYKKFSELLK